MPELRFDNAAARLGVVPSEARYRVQWSAWDNRAARRSPSGDPTTRADRRIVIPDSAWGPRNDAGVRYAIASIATLDHLFTHWATPVDVTIRDRAGSLDVVGIDRSTIDTPNVAALRAGQSEARPAWRRR